MTESRPGTELSLYVQPDSTEESLLRVAPTFVRLAAGAYWRTAQWTIETSARAGTRILRAAVSGESTAQLLQSTGEELRGYVRRILGVTNGEGGAPGPPSSETRRREEAASLKELGAELLRRSADVRLEDDAHPAYARILSDLAPDEGRILRLFALEGSQPAVDVRTSRPFNMGSELIAPGLTMIGPQAGLRHTDRVNAYLNNLFRLGLIWFSRESLTDPLGYQVLEAQPDVVEAMRRVGRSRTVRRSIHLTPFGDDFCATCLPLE